MSRMWQDFCYALRLMRKRPGFTIFAVLTLALGIGVNTAVFTVMNAILLRPLPVKDPQHLIRIYQKTSDGAVQQRFSYPDYIDFRNRNSSLSGMAAVTLIPFQFETGSHSQQILGEAVSGNYFSVLGPQTAVGRTLVEADDTPGASAAVLISNRLWRQRFSADPHIQKKTVRLNGKVYDIVGVMNPKFNGTFAGARIDVWIPVATSEFMMGKNWQMDRGTPAVQILARRNPGVALEQVEAELGSISTALEKDYLEVNRGRKILAGPATLLHGRLRKGASIFFTALMLLMGLVLFIACSNLASLLVTRALDRRHEIAIRISLGANRRHLVMQLLAESLLFAFLGGLAGLFAAIWSTGLLVTLWPVPTVPVHFDFGLDARVLAFCSGISLLTGILLGISPILQSYRPDVTNALKAESGTSLRGKMRLKNVLVTAQIAFSLLLLICAGLFVRSWQNAQQLKPGFNPQNMLALDISLSDRGYSNEEGLLYFQQLKQRVQSLPGIRTLCYSDLAPMDLATPRTAVQIQGVHPPEGANALLLSSNTISPGYFEATEIPLIQGRDFGEQDHQNSPVVVIVNETMAKRYWPNDNPVGKLFAIGKDFKSATIIGIAKDVKYRTPGEEPTPHIYLSLQQFYEPGMTLLVRTQSNPKLVQAQIEKEMASLDKDVRAFFARTMEEHLAFSVLPAKVGGSLLGIFGFLALILACVGIYAAIAFQVAQRTREIGIRMAIGAKPREILTLFIQHGFALSGIGSVIGIITALVVTRFLSALLVGVGTHDPLTFVVIPSVLIFVSVLACVVPAYRASKLDPLRSLRYE